MNIKISEIDTRSREFLLRLAESKGLEIYRGKCYGRQCIVGVSFYEDKVIYPEWSKYSIIEMNCREVEIGEFTKFLLSLKCNSQPT